MNSYVYTEIFDLVYYLNSKNFNVTFASDFEGMIRLEITNDLDPDYYTHWHLGTPGGNKKDLSKQILKTLTEFMPE